MRSLTKYMDHDIDMAQTLVTESYIPPPFYCSGVVFSASNILRNGLSVDLNHQALGCSSSLAERCLRSTSTSAAHSPSTSFPPNPHQILDGRRFARDWLEEIGEQVKGLRERIHRPPGLAVVLVGDRADSVLYVSRKQEAASKVGIAYSLHHLPSSCSQKELDSVVDRLCAEEGVDGVLVQLPLPPHLDEEKVIERFDAKKDVDGFCPLNLGRLVMRGRHSALVPCTARGSLELLTRGGVSIQGKNCVIIGDSNIVGLPLAMMMRDHGAAAVTVCHRTPPVPETSERDEASQRAHSNACLPVLPGPGMRAQERLKRGAPSADAPPPADAAQLARMGFAENLPAICREADILIVAVGAPEFVRGSWIKPGAVVLDVGINAVPVSPAAHGGPHPSSDHARPNWITEDRSHRSSFTPGVTSLAQAAPQFGGQEFKVVGDVRWAEAVAVAGALSPVPGGVGPMTIAALLQNVIDACIMRTAAVNVEAQTLESPK